MKNTEDLLQLEHVMELSHPPGLGGCDYIGGHYIDSECDAKLSDFMTWWRDNQFKQSQLVERDDS